MRLGFLGGRLGVVLLGVGRLGFGRRRRGLRLGGGRGLRRRNFRRRRRGLRCHRRLFHRRGAGHVAGVAIGGEAHAHDEQGRDRGQYYLHFHVVAPKEMNRPHGRSALTESGDIFGSPRGFGKRRAKQRAEVDRKFQTGATALARPERLAAAISP